MNATALQGAFADPPRDAARAFRTCLNVMARPGTIETLAGAIAPAPLSPAAGTLILTLCDAETPIYLAGGHDAQAIRDWIIFHTGAPIVPDRRKASFALSRWPDLAPLDGYPTGTPDYPDRSATLIVEMDALTPSGVRLSGPGLRDSAFLSLPEVDAFRLNHALFPCGLDFYFTAADRVAALPRSTKVEDF